MRILTRTQAYLVILSEVKNLCRCRSAERRRTFARPESFRGKLKVTVTRSFRVTLGLLFLATSVGCSTLKPTAGAGRSFDFQHDTFAYANVLVFSPQRDPHDADPKPQNHEHSYTRRCFIMAAGVIQFWKYARFDPQASPVSADELARRIRRVRDRAAWWPSEPPEKRVVFPGFASLRDLSEREGPALRANMGAGWTTYFQFRKYPMPFVPSHRHQAQVNEQVKLWLAYGQPLVLWLYNFPRVNINHAVTVFAEVPATEPGQFAYLVYDPNYTDVPRRLVYHTASRSFSYENTFYFVGGTVHVRPMYLGLFN